MKSRTTSSPVCSGASAPAAHVPVLAAGASFSKYRAIRTEVDGITFASKKEAKRYQELKLLERAGEISRLELQPRYVITIHGVKICTYVADFRYFTKSSLVVEDVKGVKTPAYRIKAKLMRALYNVEVLET